MGRFYKLYLRSGGKIVTDFMLSLLARAFVYAGFLLPYRLRLWIFGVGFATIIGRLSKNTHRAEANLRYIYPERTTSELRRIARASLDNTGRTIIELFSGRKFRARVAQSNATGPGIQAMQKAREQGRAIILVTAHFGNFAATGTYLSQKGYNVASLYRPLNNRFLNGFYHRAITSLASGSFESGRRGLRQMHQHLNNKGAFLIFADQYISEGKQLDFLGKPTMTPLSPAKIAAKYDAIFVPNYAVRAADGVNFELIFEEPIAVSEPCAMMQRFNDSLARQITRTPEQWLWMHRRWKPHRDAKRLAARMAPK